MNLLHLIGWGNVIAGLLLIAGRRPGGVAFCRLGRKIFEQSVFRELAYHIYDEATAPRIFLFLGIVFVIQGLAILLLAMIW